MSKKWEIRVDEKAYQIELKAAKILVNEEATPLKDCVKKKGWFQNEYEVAVGSKTAMLVVGSWIGGTKLVVDGKDCATGEEYVPLKLPGWAYVFVVLQLVNVMNGLIGFLVALAGCSATASVSTNPKFNTAVKILLDIVILVLAYGVVFGIAVAIASI